MLSEDKIKLMTGIAIFEKHEGKRIFPINRYFKSDYVSSHLIKKFISYTICWALGTLLWLLYDMESFINSLDLDQLTSLGKGLIFYYAIGLALYLGLAWIVYSRRYNYAKKSIKVYTAKLRRLDKRYEFQHKTKQLAKGGTAYDESSRF